MLMHFYVPCLVKSFKKNIVRKQHFFFLNWVIFFSLKCENVPTRSLTILAVKFSLSLSLFFYPSSTLKIMNPIYLLQVYQQNSEISIYHFKFFISIKPRQSVLVGSRANLEGAPLVCAPYSCRDRGVPPPYFGRDRAPDFVWAPRCAVPFLLKTCLGPLLKFLDPPLRRFIL